MKTCETVILLITIVAAINDVIGDVYAITSIEAPYAFIHGSNIHPKYCRNKRIILPDETIEMANTSTRQKATSLSITEPTTALIRERGKEKILVLGGTGLLGGEICRQLNARDIDFVATSTNGRGSTVCLDLTEPTASEKIRSLCKTEHFTSIISTVGSIGTSDDEKVNSACGVAIIAARNSKNVSRFVSIGNPDRVRDFARNIGPLSGYVAGKESSEQILEDIFGDDGCVIRPTFIYGGTEFGLTPPRVTSSVGNVVKMALSLEPFPTLSQILPGPLGIALEAPTSVEDVAAASINSALGLPGLEDKVSIEGGREIAIAASKRSRSPGVLKSIEISMKNDPTAAVKRRDGLKRSLVKAAVTNLDIGSNEEKAYATAEEIMEELEPLRPKARPSSDGSMNAKWAFVFTGKPSVGMKLLSTLSSLSKMLTFLIDFEDTFLEIGDEQSTVRVVIAMKLLGIPVELVVLSKLLPDRECKHGTMMSEKMEGISFAGIQVPVPEILQSPRTMEITYIDEDIMIARTAGAEPHFLLRESPCEQDDETCDVPAPYFEEAREKFGDKIAQKLLDRSLLSA